MKRSFFAILLLPLMAPTLYAEVHLPNVLSDHAVLQRDARVRIWGWAAPGEKVEVTLGKEHESAKADATGSWETSLAAHPAGGPYEIVIAGANRITLKDILFGDVYIASGQSNMGYSFAGLTDSHMPHAKEVLAASTDPMLRVLKVPKAFSATEEKDQPTKWAVSSPEADAEFSLLGYLFGRAISDREHVPVGVIHASYGGTPAEAWVSADGIATAKDLQPVVARWNKQLDAEIARKSGPSAGTEDNKNIFAGPKHPNPPQWKASALYNAMIAPLSKYTIRGVVWYQGESSTDPDRAPYYATTFRTLITDWRALWKQGDFPFIFVQIASYMAPPAMSWGTVRDAQRRTLELPNTAMVVVYDTGMPHNPHAPEKQLAADRIVLAARALIYGEKVEWSGPLFESAKTEGTSMRVKFSHASGMMFKGGEAKGFEVAGADGKFVLATATIETDSVVVKAASVAAPVYVRYAWANFTDANLYNAAGLPAAAFLNIAPAAK